MLRCAELLPDGPLLSRYCAANTPGLVGWDENNIHYSELHISVVHSYWTYFSDLRHL